MPDFSRRARDAELMETAECSYESYRDCLRDLARVNVVSMGARPTLAFLERLRRRGRWSREPLHIVDIGSGYGDALAKIARWAQRRGVAVRLTGIDSHPWSIRTAREAQPDFLIEWLCCDAFDYQEAPDIIISSLFTHHLDDIALLRFIAWMELRARLGWFINDLHRHPVSYWGFTVISTAMRWHRFVRHDGPVSIARAFRPADWTSALQTVGIQPDAAQVEPWFPYRLCVSRIKDNAPA
jgi:SAM-dependent methyltransferase